MTGAPDVSESTERPDAAAPLGDATELALRLVEETARRQQAEALAETATATADAENARATLVGLRASAVESIASVQARDRAQRMAAMHQGLLGLRSDLAGLRAAAEAAIAGQESAGPTAVVPPQPVAEGAPTRAQAPEAVGDPTAAIRPADAAAPLPGGPLDPALVRSAQELLTRGRLDVADDVIRGLEDAAARLRAQAPGPADD